MIDFIALLDMHQSDSGQNAQLQIKTVWDIKPVFEKKRKKLCFWILKK